MRHYSNDNIKVIAELAKRELARRNYSDYIEYVHEGRYQHARHTRLICERLNGILAEGNKRIVIQMPPRHSKSMTVTETFPSYYLLKNPDKRVIITAYSDDLALDFSRKNRHKVEYYGKSLFNITLSHERAAAQEWNLAHPSTGGLTAAGIMGTLTGKGGDLIIVDDPVKNAAEASSLVYRNKVHEAYLSTVLTRLHAGGSVIVIMTRWHDDDLAGRVLKAEPDGWIVINLPALCDSEDDILGRKIGEPLWIDGGYDADWAAAKQKEVGSRVWGALYQQSPTIEGGNIFKRDWFKRYTKLPDNIERWTQSWDFTFKDNDGSDFVCGGVWANKGADHYLVHRTKERLDFVKSRARMLSVSNAYPQAVTKLVEEKANGAAIISSLRSTLSGIIPIVPKESKEARAYAVAPFFEAGNVYIPHDAPWANDYINEMLAFPNGTNDDQVDMTTQYLSRFIARRGRVQARMY